MLAWIPSHLGIPGNERADTLAKEALSAQPRNDVKLPYRDLLPVAAGYSKSEIHEFLNSYRPQTGVEYMELYYDRHPRPWFTGRSLKRDEVTTICRMRSNHYGLAGSLHRKGLVESPACQCDDFTNQDLNHVLWACPRFEEARATLLGDLGKLGHHPPLAVGPLLHSPQNRIIAILMRFFAACKLSI